MFGCWRRLVKIGLVSMLGILSLQTVRAEEQLRRCTNKECRRYAVSETWTFCPYCGTELPAIKSNAEETDKQETIVGNIYKNRKLNFQIEKPNDNWKFITKQDNLNKINPDASVGMQSEAGVYNLVIAEPFPGATLEKYAQITAPDLKNRTKVSQKEVKLNDYNALKSKYTGEANGVRFHFYVTLFEAGRFKYQVVNWCVAGNDSERVAAEIETIERSFKILEAPSPKADP